MVTINNSHHKKTKVRRAGSDYCAGRFNQGRERRGACFSIAIAEERAVAGSVR